MEPTIQNMRPDERAALMLRRLYESRGFRLVRPGKFEEHALYVENKNFLQSDQIITFMDMDGRLLALKPDVTLSVVKNIPAKPLPRFQKMYYLDEVYRVARGSREYRAYNQIGIELVGPPDAFSGIEVIDLALLSLETIGDDYVLDLSHLGFVSGLLSALGISHTLERRIIAAIHAKRMHELSALLEEAGVDESGRNRLLALAGLHGDISAALQGAKELILGDEMRAAWDELTVVANALSYNGYAGHLNLDFSVVGELDYYNGLIFRGYLGGIPQSLLTGGRYDNLMHKMGKKCGAVGFGVTLDELSTYIRSGRRYDFDILLTYAPDSNWAALLETVRELTHGGHIVRLEQESADLSAADYTWRRRMHFAGDNLMREGESTC